VHPNISQSDKARNTASVGGIKKTILAAIVFALAISAPLLATNVTGHSQEISTHPSIPQSSR
jgi:hypothetical protein